MQQRRRPRLVKHTGDQRGIAVDIGTDLQHGGPAIAAGERDQVGLGHHPRYLHRAPGQALGAQDQADLLLDEAPKGVDGLVGEVLGEDAEDDLGPTEDGLAQLARLLQLLAQLLPPLVAQLLWQQREYDVIA